MVQAAKIKMLTKLKIGTLQLAVSFCHRVVTVASTTYVANGSVIEFGIIIVLHEKGIPLGVGGTSWFEGSKAMNISG